MLVLLLGVGFELADASNNTNNDTDDDFECTVNSDCDLGEICISGECEDNETDSDDDEDEIDSYEDCIAAGNPIMESAPPRCRDPLTGRTFVQGEDDSDEDEEEKDGLGSVIRGRVKAGVYTSESGEEFKVRDLAQNRTLLIFGDGEDMEVETELEIEEETENGITKIKVKLKNGRDAEIKIMPDTASQRALERLRLKVCSEENNCTIELKEVGERKDSAREVRLAYELQIERHSRIIGIFKKKMNVHAQIDAENGEIVVVDKPWWAWLAREPAAE